MMKMYIEGFSSFPLEKLKSKKMKRENEKKL